MDLNKISSSPSRRNARAQVGLLALGHAVTDAYAAFLSPLWPILVAKLGISMSLVGLSTSVMNVSASFMQPLYGYWADRTRRRIFVVAGPGISAFFMCLIGIVPSYAALIAAIALAGVGVAAFHPQAATSVGTGSYRRKGLALSVFITGGAVGYAAGPLIASSFSARYGLENLYLLAFPGVLTSLTLYLFMAAPPLRPVPVGLAGVFRDLRPRLKPLSALYAMSALRSASTIGLVTFLPFLLRERGLSLVEGGGMVSLFLLAGSVGGMVGGTLSDRIDRRTLLSGSLAAATPLLMAMNAIDHVGLSFATFLALASFTLAFSNPVNVILAQELIPNSVNTASALMIGSSWGTGGLIAATFGLFADAYGVPALLRGIAFVPAGAALLGLILFRRQVAQTVDSQTFKRA